MIRLICTLLIHVLCIVHGHTTISNVSGFQIGIIQPYNPWQVDDGQINIKLNQSNGDFSISWSLVNHTDPFTVIRQLQTVPPTTDDLIIIEDVLCWSSEALERLHNVSTTCHSVFANRHQETETCRFKFCPAEDQQEMCHVFNTGEGQSIVTVLQQVLQALSWDIVYVFHDWEMDDIVKDLFDRLALPGIKLVTNMISVKSADQHLHNLIYSFYNDSKANNRNFLVLCRDGCVNRLLELVDGFDMRNSNRTAIWLFSKWLVYEHKATQPFNTGVKVNNVAVITLPNVISPHSASSVKENLQNHLENVYIHCIEEYDANQTVHVNMKQELESDSECWKGSIQTLLYKESQTRQLALVGEFDKVGRLNILHDVFPNVKQGFNGRTLYIGTADSPPFVFETNNTQSGWDGLCMDLLNQISSTLNFTYELSKPPDGEWGREVNGSWTGMVRQMQYRERDLIIGPLTVSIQREAVMDFTVPFYYDHAAGVYKMPDPGRYKWLKLIKPFKGMVLACLGVALLVSAVLLCLMENTFSTLSTGKSPPIRNTFQDSIWYLYGAMLAHGGSHQPVSESGRVLVGFWWLFCIVIAASYSGTLIAFLTVNKETVPFETLAELADQSEYKWGITGGSSWVTYFEDAPTQDIEKLWQGMLRFSKDDPEVFTVRSLDQMKKVAEGAYVFFSDSERISLWTSQNCDQALIKETFYPFTYALGLPERSPYAEIISETMLAIDQSGLFLTWKRKWWPRNNLCLDTSKTNARKIQLDDLQSAFYLTAIGVVAAGLVLALEKLSAYGCGEIQASSLKKQKV